LIVSLPKTAYSGDAWGVHDAAGSEMDDLVINKSDGLLTVDEDSWGEGGWTCYDHVGVRLVHTLVGSSR